MLVYTVFHMQYIVTYANRSVPMQNKDTNLTLKTVIAWQV